MGRAPQRGTEGLAAHPPRLHGWRSQKRNSIPVGLSHTAEPTHTPDFFQATNDGLVQDSFWIQAGSRHLPAPTHDGALLDWRLSPGVRSIYGPVAAAVGALGGPAAGARASGCAHSRLPPHAALPFVGSFLRWCARPVCLRATAWLVSHTFVQLIPRLRRACNVVVLYPPTSGGSDQLSYMSRSLGVSKPLLAEAFSHCRSKYEPIVVYTDPRQLQLHCCRAHADESRCQHRR
eukprot:COSAG01_NODE_44_length_32259_cov_19.234297_2_plen_233_part_00